MFKRGELYWVDSTPTKGRESRGPHLWVVLQNTGMFPGFGTVLMAPLYRATPIRQSYPLVYQIIVPNAINKLDVNRVIDVFQTRAIDVASPGRLIANKAAPFGKLTDTEIDFAAAVLALITS